MIECHGFVKIGIAVNVHARLASLQTGSPFKLTLLTSFASGSPQEEEEAIHALLEQYRVRGEWFELPAPMIDHLLKGRSWRQINKPRPVLEPEYHI